MLPIPPFRGTISTTIDSSWGFGIPATTLLETNIFAAKNGWLEDPSLSYWSHPEILPSRHGGEMKKQYFPGNGLWLSIWQHQHRTCRPSESLLRNPGWLAVEPRFVVWYRGWQTTHKVILRWFTHNDLGGGFKHVFFLIFTPTWGTDPLWTNIFQMAWNHQLEKSRNCRDDV